MNKTILTCSFLLITMLALADEFEQKFGRGVVHIQPDSLSVIDFYSEPGSPVIHQLEFKPLPVATDVYYAVLDTSRNFPSWFNPLFVMKSAEYSRVDFIGVDSSEGFYKTILKDDLGREVWVKKSKYISFITWFGFYSQMSSIELLTEKTILYTEPNDNAVQVDYTAIMNEDDRSFMRVLDVQYFWMKVELQVAEPDPKKPWKAYTGWIKWRNEKEPLIKYNLMGC